MPLTTKQKRKLKPVRPVKVNVAVQKAYRDKLQAANQQYKRQVDKKVARLVKQIEGLDRSKPDAFAKQAGKIQASIATLERNRAAADKRSIKAVQQFIRQTNKENKRRTIASFKGKVGEQKTTTLLAEKQAIVDKRLAKLEKEYIDSITSANRDYSDRVQGILYEALAKPSVFTRKKNRPLQQARKARGIVSRRIKNTVQNQAHEANATMNRTRQAALGAKQYRWRTKEDNKVRPTHVEMGAPPDNVYSWAKRPGPTGHPGEDHGCRCIAEPLL